MDLQLPSPVTHLDSRLLRDKGITLDIKRDDLIHPVLQGNKWRKLKYNLSHARQLQQNTLLTFGGAYSNHIHATAAAGYCFGFSTIGVIRGESESQQNPTLQDVSNWGMQLHFVSRSDYRHKHEPAFIASLHAQFGDFYLIPEGGSNADAITGCQEIMKELNEDYDIVCAACGTGTTLAGIICASPDMTRVIGFPVMKNASFLNDSIVQHLKQTSLFSRSNWELQLDYHFGGYGRITSELINFITTFKQQFDISLDPVYTGKMFYGVFDLIKRDYFKTGSRILLLHSGGLQGLRGFDKQINVESISSERQ
ncbi:MAG: 1-aminocyclopropane-1-carboxylate deaminase/D-cysteine desulfhydrase [Gammaproteobacteria bacterium]|nr:MAG: 1-aminocyclopropane-1-carboxylate deaminase/D-cysteine desulfhydrase [Gammaproteobacteria bacterium]